MLGKDKTWAPKKWHPQSTWMADQESTSPSITSQPPGRSLLGHFPSFLRISFSVTPIGISSNYLSSSPLNPCCGKERYTDFDNESHRSASCLFYLAKHLYKAQQSLKVGLNIVPCLWGWKANKLTRVSLPSPCKHHWLKNLFLLSSSNWPLLILLFHPFALLWHHTFKLNKKLIQLILFTLNHLKIHFCL